MVDNNSDETREGIRRLQKSGSMAELFLTAQEKMDKSNFTRLFNQELKRLGKSHDDEAMEIAKKLELKGFNAMEKWRLMSDQTENDEK